MSPRICRLTPESWRAVLPFPRTHCTLPLRKGRAINRASGTGDHMLSEGAWRMRARRRHHRSGRCLHYRFRESSAVWSQHSSCMRSTHSPCPRRRDLDEPAGGARRRRQFRLVDLRNPQPDGTGCWARCAARPGLAIASGTLGVVLAIARDGWISLFIAVAVVGGRLSAVGPLPGDPARVAPGVPRSADADQPRTAPGGGRNKAATN